MPRRRSFRSLAPAFLVPYALYVAIRPWPALGLGPAEAQALKLVAVATALLAFRPAYRFGPCRPRDLWAAVAALPALLLLWMVPLRAGLALQGSIHATVAPAWGAYAALRALCSVLLPPLFEELLCRVYLPECVLAIGRGPIGPVPPLDRLPAPIHHFPLRGWALAVPLIFFTAGHPPAAYASAALYFLATTWLYRWTGSLWTCIAAHAGTNLAIAVLAQRPGLAYLWY